MTQEILILDILELHIFHWIFVCSMAGVNQITKYGFKYGNIWTYFDDFRDNEMIKKGFYLYKGWFQ